MPKSNAAPHPPATTGPGVICPLRLGIVPYLNVQPLVWSLQHPDSTTTNSAPPVELRPSPPRELATQLERGDHDAAIVPVFEYLRRPDYYTIVPGASIAAHGEVYSVLLFSSVPVSEISRVYLDPASLTSVNLLKVLMAQLHRMPQYVNAPHADWRPGKRLPKGDAALLIGDPAILERGKQPYHFDLGNMWTEQTGLPFVFAAWLVHPSARKLPINDILLQAKQRGVEQLEQIATEAGPRFGIEPAEALRYFQQNLCYDLGPPELAGWQRFAELCQKHGLIDRVPHFHMHRH